MTISYIKLKQVHYCNEDAKHKLYDLFYTNLASYFDIHCHEYRILCSGGIG